MEISNWKGFIITRLQQYRVMIDILASWTMDVMLGMLIDFNACLL